LYSDLNHYTPYFFLIKGLDAPSTTFAIGGSGGLGVKTALAGHNAVDGGSGRGGEAYFAGGGSGFYGPGGMDEYFQQSGPTPALSVTERRLPAPPMHNGSGHREKLEGRRHLGGFGGGGAPCAMTMGGGGGGGYGGGGGGMHGGGGGGSFISKAGGVATLLKEVTHNKHTHFVSSFLKHTHPRFAFLLFHEK
jgi:hypothetical protein